MSEVGRNKAFDRAVDLVVHADDLTNQWTGRLIAVQTSLVVAEAALLVWKGDQSGAIVAALAVLIGLTAIVSLFAVTRIIVREHDTGHGYIGMVKRTEGQAPYLFRDEDQGPPGPRFARVVGSVKWTLVAGWVGFLVIVVKTAIK